MTSLKLSAVKNNIATLNFNLKSSKVNILRSDVLAELEQQLDKIAQNQNIKLLIITSSKENNFIAGADIKEIADITSKKLALEKVAQGQNILDKIAKLPCITIAYIHGTCLGGGTELALACDFRVASDDAKTLIGLPEVNLGIIPGFGGTQRLPRLIGLVAALPLILTGKSVNYKKAYRLKLIDHYFPKEYEKTRLTEFTDNILNNNSYRQKILNRRKNKLLFLEKISFIRELILKKARANVIKKTHGKYPAPLQAIEVLKYSYNASLARGLKIELDYFAKLVTGKICKNLIHLYFINEEVKKDFAIKKNDILPIKQAGVIGSGIMGGGIAWFYSKLNLAVRMKDINWQNIAIGYQQIFKNYKTLLKIRKITKSDMINKTALVTASLDNKGFKNCDVISEAVVEDITIKKKVLKEFEPYLKENAIIASNTSSLSINEMSKALKHPERFIGMHFFNPVNRMPLVEIIPHKKTDPKVTNTIVSLVRKAGKTPIIVGDCAGFLVNRLLLTYMNEAFLILDECGDIARIDKIMSDFGMPMGPFTLADTVGLDVGYKVACSLEKAYGKRMEVADLIKKIYVEKKLLGKKSGAGFYLYDNKKPQINPVISQLCKSDTPNIDDKDILDRLILIMVNEAHKALQEKIVTSEAQLDLAMIMGTGFPPYRGGLMRYAHERGIENINNRLAELEKTYGSRFKPA